MERYDIFSDLLQSYAIQDLKKYLIFIFSKRFVVLIKFERSKRVKSIDTLTFVLMFPPHIQT